MRRHTGEKPHEKVFFLLRLLKTFKVVKLGYTFSKLISFIIKVKKNYKSFFYNYFIQ